jgi:hypothetical protein
LQYPEERKLEQIRDKLDTMAKLTEDEDLIRLAVQRNSLLCCHCIQYSIDLFEKFAYQKVINKKLKKLKRNKNNLEKESNSK